MVITWAQLKPSITNWWALAISFKLFVWLNCSDISCKIRIPNPRSEELSKKKWGNNYKENQIIKAEENALQLQEYNKE